MLWAWSSCRTNNSSANDFFWPPNHWVVGNLITWPHWNHDNVLLQVVCLTVPVWATDTIIPAKAVGCTPAVQRAFSMTTGPALQTWSGMTKTNSVGTRPQPAQNHNQWNKYFNTKAMAHHKLSVGIAGWYGIVRTSTWWRHQMKTFSALLTLCVGIQRLPVISPHKDQWGGALIFSLICVWTKGWEQNRDNGDLKRHRAHYDVTVMIIDT